MDREMLRRKVKIPGSHARFFAYGISARLGSDLPWFFRPCFCLISFSFSSPSLKYINGQGLGETSGAAAVDLVAEESRERAGMRRQRHGRFMISRMGGGRSCRFKIANARSPFPKRGDTSYLSDML
jgi:hypothetical protein